MAEYLRYVIQNIEPLRIADDSTSQSGQTISLRYIPGTTIRGVVINYLSAHPKFEEYKKLLFSDKIRYLNAYLMENDRELIPSPKGFYEDKTSTSSKKELENVVIKGKFSEGKKRAALGHYCYLENNTVRYYSIQTDSDMKMKINLENENEKQNVFRNEYMVAGNQFYGYIVVEDSSVKEMLKEVFSQDIYIGNARSAGLGRCKVLELSYLKENQFPYSTYMPSEGQKDFCYMMLLSNTVMRNADGEYCGLDTKKLEQVFGVSNLEIEYCSTSTVDVKGYNRTLGIKLPSVVMYEQGSVFYFKYKGTLSSEKMRQIMEQGIGVRRNEGFGRVLFLKDYEKIKYKKEGRRTEKTQSGAVKLKDDTQTLKIAAANYYRKLIRQAIQKTIVDKPIKKGGISNSQIGTVESLITANRYAPEEGKKALRDYFKHGIDKEDANGVQKERKSIQEFRKYVEDVLDNPLADTIHLEQRTSIMGIPVTELIDQQELERYKLNYLVDAIRFDNREEKI